MTLSKAERDKIKAASAARVAARAKTTPTRAAKVLPRARANKAAAVAIQAEAAAERLAAEEALTAETNGQLEVIKARGKAQAAERRTRAALARAENTEILLQQERERVANLEAALSAQPGEGNFDRDAAHTHTHGVPTPGKKTSEVKKTARGNLYAAFEEMGGVEELVRWGRSQPTEFYRIWARLIPVEVEDESKNMPLETLLTMLTERADMTVAAAAAAIGTEILENAKQEVDMEAAAAAFQASQGE